METNVCDPRIGGGVSAATDGALAAEIKVPSGFAFGMSKHVAFDTDDVSIYKTFTEKEHRMTRSRNLTVGLVLSAILAAVDIVGLAGFGTDDAPPAGVMIVGAVLGVITLAGVRMAWRNGQSGLSMVIASRVLSALLGVPAFFTDDVPSWVPVAVGISMALTAVAVGFILGARRAAGDLHAAA